MSTPRCSRMSLDQAHLLFTEVCARRVERGMVKDDEFPGGVTGRREITRKPVAEVGVRPIHVDVRIEKRPVRVAIVEGVVGHAREGRSDPREMCRDAVRSSFDDLGIG